MLDRKYFFGTGRCHVGAARWHRCAFVKPSIEETVTIQTHYSTRMRKYIRDCVYTSLKVFTNNCTGRNNRANNSVCARSVIVYTVRILELVFSYYLTPFFSFNSLCMASNGWDVSWRIGKDWKGTIVLPIGWWSNIDELFLFGIRKIIFKWISNTGYSQKNGVVSKVNKKSISHLTRAQRTPSAAATIQVSHALPAVRFSCLLRGRGAPQ